MVARETVPHPSCAYMLAIGCYASISKVNIKVVIFMDCFLPLVFVLLYRLFLITEKGPCIFCYFVFLRFFATLLI